MKRMGFSTDPGALPFYTIRRIQWANRVSPGELIEIHGEHGCAMPPTAARVVTIVYGRLTDIAELHNPYSKNEQVCTILLEAPPDKWEKVDETWVKK